MTVPHLGTKYHLGPMRISCYMSRHHGFTISDACIYCILKRNGLSRLLSGTRVRTTHSQRYEQPVLGLQIQVDVKFLKFERDNGKSLRRF